MGLEVESSTCLKREQDGKGSSLKGTKATRTTALARTERRREQNLFRRDLDEVHCRSAAAVFSDRTGLPDVCPLSKAVIRRGSKERRACD